MFVDVSDWLGNGVPTRRQALTGDIEVVSSPKNAVLTEHILGMRFGSCFYMK